MDTLIIGASISGLAAAACLQKQGVSRSRFLVMATGAYGRPRPVHFEGLESFPGPVLHSCDYKTGAVFAGQRVLVVGFGNSACEIAVDPYEQGALPSMSVRGRRLEDLRVPSARQVYFGMDGLYFCGYWISPTGQIREIGLDARRRFIDLGQALFEKDALCVHPLRR